VFHFILNAYWEPLEFELPRVGNDDENSWRRWIDTTFDSPNDIVEWETAPTVPGRTYRAGPRSVVVLFARLGANSQMDRAASPKARNSAQPSERFLASLGMTKQFFPVSMRVKLISCLICPVRRPRTDGR
jgi:hypothetical protein